ncbi:FAD-binding protein [Sinimarinibacterium sp. CAU 1509]|uniref:FAD-binding protein n=1 Tax=Sinimarinibacterium sp. CAU 1509 TaxID=2562283 RepID=UPI0010ABA876|nr:FAD-binding protein [Sinimarinibacterium sp. CAU 1509]TJY58854.1 FAD-binding protein [Sinimarinibacterium sp. CAU 1509]
MTHPTSDQSQRPSSGAADGTLPVDAPLRVAGAGAIQWHRQCELLVVGYGAAGVATAISAHESGTDVLVAERFEGGGATIKSGGVVYLGGGTRYQRDAGYEDTPDEMFRYLQQETGDAVSDAELRRFCDGSLELLEWLEARGARFQSYAHPPKTSYPKDGVYLYYSGNESVPAFAEKARPAPRGHRVVAAGIDAGRVLYQALRSYADRLKFPVLQQTSVRRLIIDERSGAVLGAEVAQLTPGSAEQQLHQKLMRRAEKVHNFAGAWADRLRARALQIEQQHAKRLHVRATRGVALCTGGFVFNRSMVAQYAPKYLPAMRLGATGCDGSGIRLGESAGGAPTRMEKGSAWRFINPPTAWPLGVVVNRRGERFCNEQVYGARLGVEMCENNGGKAYLVIDRALRRRAIREALFGGLWAFQGIPALILMLFAPRAKTPELLADKLGLPRQALRSTIDQYSADTRAGAVDALGKDTAFRAPLETPPYYAMDISADSKTFPCPTITLGGLRVEETSGAVLDTEGNPIAGLFAAGRAAVGVASNGYVSGLSIADCLWSGRRIGRHLASQQDKQQAA